MGSRDGHIELDWAVDAIVVGTRHRTDLGDIDALASSIDRHGLLQPLTLTSQGVLVCGYRRLTAIKKLNWRTTGVWIRSGVSDRLGHLLAEQDDNNHHKALTQTEAAALYRETKTLMAEDAARRKKATQFSSDNQPGNGGPANLAAPSPADAAEAPAGAMGTAREQAARLITGRASYTTLERTGFLQQLLEDPATAEHVRAEAATGLEQIEAGAPVHPIYERLRSLAGQATERRQDDLDEMAKQALARVRAAEATKRPRSGQPSRPRQSVPGRWPVRAFLTTFEELTDWWTHYDPATLAAELTDEQAEMFLGVATGTADFAEQLRAAREALGDEQARTARGHLHAI